MRTIFGILLLFPFFSAYAQRVPKANDLARFVQPGTEDAFFGHLPEVITADMLGIEIFPAGTVEAAKRKYPRYLWQGAGHELNGAYPRDPDDATKHRLLYTFGLDSSKRIAYRNLKNEVGGYKKRTIGPKILIKEMPTEDEVEYDCMHYVETGLFSGSRDRSEERRSGQWWFTCRAAMSLPVLRGDLFQH